MGTSTKAEKFKADALDAGWKAEIRTNGKISTVTATREEDGAVMEISWEGEACLNKSTLTIDGHTRKLRNAAACRRELSGDAPAKSSSSGKKSTPKTAPVRRISAAEDEEQENDETPRAADPVWGRAHANAPDIEIIGQVLGRTITWRHELKRDVESATVLPKPNQRQIRIEKSPINGRRILTFAAADEGIRSVYVERIVAVA